MVLIPFIITTLVIVFVFFIVIVLVLLVPGCFLLHRRCSKLGSDLIRIV